MGKDREKTSQQIAAEAISEVKKKGKAEDREHEPIVTLSTGVKLRCKKVSEMMVADIYNEFNKQRPQVPVYLNKSKGREEENPADPDYLDAVQAWEIEAALALNNVLIIEGTEILEIPEDVPAQDDEQWVQKMAALGRPMDNEYLVYLQWVKYIAGPKVPDDARAILTEVARLSGIQEGDVEIAVQNFPGEPG